MNCKIFLVKYCVLSGLLMLAACGVGSNTIANDEPEGSAQLKELCDQLADVKDAVRRFNMSRSQEDFDRMVELSNNYPQPEELEQMVAVELKDELRELSFQSDSMKLVLEGAIKNALKAIKKPVVTLDDQLIEEAVTYPAYLERGRKLYIGMQTEGNVTLRLVNADSKQTIKTYVGKKDFVDSMVIPNSAIYLFDFVPKGTLYVNFIASKTVNSIEELNVVKEIAVENKECSKGDFRAQRVDGINMTNLFEEPRKITLRSQAKAYFSGSSRSVVAVQIPSGTSTLLYSLRISTNETDKSEDGQFCSNMRRSYHKIKFLGLPVYESTRNKSSLIRELLNENVPPREEDAFCNMFVFKSSDQAKKFQDGQPTANLRYDIDRSTIGTQSCNGSLNVKGMRTIYLGFENERFRYSNYLWLEVIAAVPHTEYYRATYSLKE